MDAGKTGCGFLILGRRDWEAQPVVRVGRDLIFKGIDGVMDGLPWAVPKKRKRQE